MSEHGRSLAKIALEIKGIKLNPQQPFLWASGYYMPIYNDNRMLLGNFEHRKIIASGFVDLISKLNLDVEVIAGTATAGIPPATSLADSLQKPLIYVRSSAKDHGLRNTIEGILLPGQKVLMIEDLISTGGSSVTAIEDIRGAGGKIENCFSIFSYGLNEAISQFNNISCKVNSLLTYDILLEEAVAQKYINQHEFELLQTWRENPFSWGEKNGFPKVEKNK